VETEQVLVRLARMDELSIVVVLRDAVLEHPGPEHRTSQTVYIVNNITETSLTQAASWRKP